MYNFIQSIHVIDGRGGRPLRKTSSLWLSAVNRPISPQSARLLAMATPGRPPLSPLNTGADGPKRISKTSLRTTAIKLAASSSAVIERPAEAVTADAEHAALYEPSARESFHRSATQLEKLRRAFWLHRTILERWEEQRVVRTRKANNGDVLARWDPPTPSPPWGDLASSDVFGIYLPVRSVQSFFGEYKREIRKQIKDGHLPANFVRATRAPMLYAQRPHDLSSDVILWSFPCSLTQLPRCRTELPPRSEWPVPTE
jgi:hypothetical protein